MKNTDPVRQEEISCPNLIQINADIDSKKRICFNWCSFLIITFIFYLSLLALPDSLQSVGIWPCDHNKTFTYLNYSCPTAINKPFSAYPQNIFLVTGMQELNIFLLFQFNFKIHSPSQIQSKFNITYDLQLYGFNVEHSQVDDVELLIQKSHHTVITCQQGQLDQYLDCMAPLVYYPKLGDYSNYLIMINANPNATSNQNVPSTSLDSFQSVHFSAQTIHEDFTQSLIAIKYTFLIVSLITLILYCLRLRKIDKKDWVIEQKMVLVFAFLLPMFNDPFFAATVLIPNRVTAVIGVIFVSDFVCFMSLYQLVQFHRIIHENGDRTTNAVTPLKIAICFVMWIFMVASYIIVEMRFFDDPSNTYEDYNGSAFVVLKIIYYLIVGIILLYIIYYYVQFCRSYESRLWRYKQIGVFSIYFIVSLQLFIFTGSFSQYQFDGTKVLLTIAILNLYVFYLQYLWSPSKLGIKQQDDSQKDLVEVVIRTNQSYDQLDEDKNYRGIVLENQDINIDD